jgi:hypothetical protein
MRAGGRHLFTPREVVPPTHATISGPKFFGKVAAPSSAANEPPSAADTARAEKVKVEAAMQALREVDMASGPVYAQLQDRLVAMDIVLGEHAAARREAVPLEVRLSRVAKVRDETSKKLARMKELLGPAAEELRKALKNVNDLLDPGRAQEAKFAKLTVELRELGQKMSEEAERVSSEEEEDEDGAKLDDPMATPRNSDAGLPEGSKLPACAAPTPCVGAGHTSCGCLRARWGDLSSSSVDDGPQEGFSALLAQGAEVLERLERPEGEPEGPDDSKRPKNRAA